MQLGLISKLGNSIQKQKTMIQFQKKNDKHLNYNDIHLDNFNPTWTTTTTTRQIVWNSIYTFIIFNRLYTNLQFLAQLVTLSLFHPISPFKPNSITFSQLRISPFNLLIVTMNLHDTHHSTPTSLSSLTLQMVTNTHKKNTQHHGRDTHWSYSNNGYSSHSFTSLNTIWKKQLPVDTNFSYLDP